MLGIIGALDPHTHKLNLAQLQGEGRLEREGVRPQFPNKNPPELGEAGGTGTGEGVTRNAGRVDMQRAELALVSSLEDLADVSHTPDPTRPPPGGLPGGEQALDLLPSAGLVTSSEDYYPTVAINALMRVLREPSMAALHGKAVAALFEIIKAMGLSFVPYLPKVGGEGGCCLLWWTRTRGWQAAGWDVLVCHTRAFSAPTLHHARRLLHPSPNRCAQVVPVLLQLTRGADDLQRRVDMVRGRQCCWRLCLPCCLCAFCLGRPPAWTALSLLHLVPVPKPRCFTSL